MTSSPIAMFRASLLVPSIWTKVVTDWTTTVIAVAVASWTVVDPLVSGIVVPRIVTAGAHLVVVGAMPLRVVLSGPISATGPTCLT